MSENTDDSLKQLTELIVMTKNEIINLKIELSDIKIELRQLKDENNRIFTNVTSLIQQLRTI